MKQICLFLGITLYTTAFGQNVGIGTANPQASAALEVNSADKGFLMPRNTDPAANVNAPAAGLMVYNNSTNEPNYFNGTEWRSMGNLAGSFQSAVAFQSTAFSALPPTVDFVWAVPPGVTKVWIEIWAAGDAGSKLPSAATDELSALGGSGGDAGNYLSITLPVATGSNIAVSVGKGGTTTYSSGGASSISYGNVKYTVSQSAEGFTYTVGNIVTSPIPGVLAMVAGSGGGASTQAFQQTGASTFRRVITGGTGGDAYLGGKGSVSKTVSYDMATGDVFPIGLYTGGVRPGSMPGGGGGAAFGSPGAGGPGLVILHY